MNHTACRTIPHPPIWLVTVAFYDGGSDDDTCRPVWSRDQREVCAPTGDEAEALVTARWDANDGDLGTVEAEGTWQPMWASRKARLVACA